MNYDEAISYIENKRRDGMKPGLDRMRELCRRLGGPERKLTFIHVAGTNGKGAVSAFISSILAVCGCLAGRYVSPAVFQYEECIRYEDLNGEHYIDKELLAQLVTEIAGAVSSMEAEGWESPSVFEIETAMAFLAFVHWKCSIVILEAGLGGREDATNVIESATTVITPISLDHTAVLGDTVEEIAEQKAGIIKGDSPVVTLQPDPAALAVLRERTEEQGAVLTVVDREDIQVLSAGLGGSVFSYKGENFRVSMPGLYQVENACLAIETCRRLPGFIFDAEQLMLGVRQAVWRGRFEVVSTRPLILIDGAHNPAGARALRDSIKALLPGKRLHALMGVFADKDYREMVRILAPCFVDAALVTAPGPRGLPAEKLSKVWNGSCPVSLAGSVTEGLKQALSRTDKGDAVLLFGSLSLFRELKWR